MPVISKHASLPLGTRFDRLVTIGKPYPITRHKTAGPVWVVEARCDCGKEVVALVWQLKAFKTKSCGCLKAFKHTAIVFPGRKNELMSTNAVAVQVFETPDEAPNYRRDFPQVKAANIVKICIVKNGTQEGNPTVDMIFEDHEGKTHVAMITQKLLKVAAGLLPPG